MTEQPVCEGSYEPKPGGHALPDWWDAQSVVVTEGGKYPRTEAEAEEVRRVVAGVQRMFRAFRLPDPE